MKKDNIVLSKTYTLALQIIELYLYVCNEKKEYVFSKQILKSGTSIGANAEEAIGALSRKDFKSKLSISYKEARETHYWLRLLRDSKFIDQNYFLDLIDDCEELLKIIGTILKTLKNPNS